jgi:hypothetical protein
MTKLVSFPVSVSQQAACLADRRLSANNALIHAALQENQEYSDALPPFSVIAPLLGVTKTRISWEWKLWRLQKSRRNIAHKYAEPEFLFSENCSAHFSFRRKCSGKWGSVFVGID